jgi:cell division protein FtsB
MKPPKNILYIVLGVIALLFLLANPGSRRLFRRYWELYKLNGELQQQKKANNLLKRDIYLLENDPAYIERIARKELGLIAPGEVEYRFKKKE